MGAALDRDVINEIVSRGGWARKIHGSEYQAGVPDILGCYRGVFLGLENKKGTDRLSAIQKSTLRKIEKAGGVAAEIRNLDQVRAILDEIDVRNGT